VNMNVGKWIGGAFTELVDSLGKNVDRFVTSQEDKQKLKRLMKETVQKHRLSLEQEISKRHASDMNSDSWLSKNVRPLVLIYSLAFLTVMAFTDGNLQWGEWQFTVKDSYVALLKQLLTAAVMFYFGSRGVEKLGNAWRKRKEHQDESKQQQDDG